MDGLQGKIPPFSVNEFSEALNIRYLLFSPLPRLLWVICGGNILILDRSETGEDILLYLDDVPGSVTYRGHWLAAGATVYPRCRVLGILSNYL